MPPLEVSLQARLEAFKAFRVKHPRLEEMDRDLMRAISGHRSYTRLSVYGASGVGKSTVMKRVAERCREEEPHPAVVPAVVVQASPEDIGTSARLDYHRQILDQLRSHVAVKDRVMNSRTGPLSREKRVVIRRNGWICARQWCTPWSCCA